MIPGIRPLYPPMIKFLPLLIFVGFAEGEKLLVMPMDGSAWLSTRLIVEKLHQNGHEIVLVVPETNLFLTSAKNFTIKTYPVPYKDEHMDALMETFGKDRFVKQPFLNVVISLYKSLARAFQMLFQSCESLLSNKELIRYLEESQFDAILTDPVGICGTIVAEYLSLPSVFFLRGFPCDLGYKATQCPSPHSYVPGMFTSSTDHMTFTQRVQNLLHSTLALRACITLYSPFEQLASEFLQREVSVHNLLDQGSVWLMRLDFVFEYPRPVMPNMVFVGGLNCAEKKHLSQTNVVFVGGINCEEGKNLPQHLQVQGCLAQAASSTVIHAVHFRPRGDHYDQSKVGEISIGQHIPPKDQAKKEAKDTTEL
ncbi:UDP-glucuronosyltransferase 1A4-like [Eretmochelys imbricata]